MRGLADARVLVVGAGGLGCPTMLALAHAGVGTIAIADDDTVDASNLHRQILFSDGDVGKDKCAAAARAIERDFLGVRVRVHNTRFLPQTSAELLRDVDLVVEGSDNFATKFLVADACMLAQKPVVHGAAIRWHGTALSVSPQGAPCYRCLFEDIPWEAQEACSTAGVMGPVCGVIGALMADLALSALASIAEGARSLHAASLVTFDGKTGELRRRSPSRRKDCELCGDRASIRAIDRERYRQHHC